MPTTTNPITPTLPFLPDVTPVTLTALTAGTVDGAGIFDALMRAQKAHLDAEFTSGRIKGAEYASVYLGSIQAVMQAALQFILQKDSVALAAKKLQAEVELVKQQILNAQVEQGVLLASECKLRAEFDSIQEQTLRIASETALINQKLLTERAQTVAMGVDPDSVIGRQKGLYAAQTNGYTRDAEQKAADLMIKSWATRRTTDEGTVADATNMLYDQAVGRAVNKLLTGVGA